MACPSQIPEGAKRATRSKSAAQEPQDGLPKSNASAVSPPSGSLKRQRDPTAVSTTPVKKERKTSRLTATPTNPRAGPMIDLDAQDSSSDDPNMLANPDAIALFAQVADIKEFRSITIVFWISYSAYHRGPPHPIRTSLLQYVAIQSGREKDRWWMNDEYLTVWEREYMFVINSYAKKFDGYATQWSKSPAGVAYVNERARLISSRTKSTIALEASDIEKLVLKSPVSHTGIAWGVEQIFDCFSILADVSPTAKIEDADGSASWFMQDLDAVKSETLRKKLTPDVPPVESWYTKLASTASTTLIQCIYLHMGVADIHGHKHTYNDASLHGILARVPTPSWSRASSRYPSFAIDDCTYQVWVDHIAATYHAPKPATMLDTRIERNVKAFVHGERSYELTSDDDDDYSAEYSVQFGNKEEERSRQSLEMMCRENGIDPEAYGAADFASASSIPLANMRPDYIDSFVAHFVRSNVFGQSDMVFDLVVREQRRLELIAESCYERRDDLGKSLSRLDDELAILRDYSDQAEREYKEYNEITKTVQDRQAAKEDYRRNQPTVFRQFKRSANGISRRGSGSPFTSGSGTPSTWTNTGAGLGIGGTGRLSHDRGTSFSQFRTSAMERNGSNSDTEMSTEVPAQDNTAGESPVVHISAGNSPVVTTGQGLAQSPVILNSKGITSPAVQSPVILTDKRTPVQSPVVHTSQGVETAPSGSNPAVGPLNRFNGSRDPLPRAHVTHTPFSSYRRSPTLPPATLVGSTPSFHASPLLVDAPPTPFGKLDLEDSSSAAFKDRMKSEIAAARAALYTDQQDTKASDHGHQAGDEKEGSGNDGKETDGDTGNTLDSAKRHEKITGDTGGEGLSPAGHSGPVVNAGVGQDGDGMAVDSNADGALFGEQKMLE